MVKIRSIHQCKQKPKNPNFRLSVPPSFGVKCSIYTPLNRGGILVNCSYLKFKKKITKSIFFGFRAVRRDDLPDRRDEQRSIWAIE